MECDALPSADPAPSLTFALQALLVRYNASVADAERDRSELSARIEQLEMDKKELEAENVRTVAENRALLDQLETLNTTVADSDVRIKSLETTLHSSQLAVRRLEGASQRAEDMEGHLALLEQEQAALQRTLLDTESERRSAMSRWKKAERGISDLQQQLERMEKEAKEERERHVELMGKVERQRAMEKELNTAAGRLKGAAAAKSMQDSKSGSNVVSHFVRDLLQDNANLQVGLAEMRELLMNSHDEIQMLRDQLMLHQPVEEEPDVSATSTLRAELDTVAPTPQSTPTKHATQHSPSLSQELHIHHHYHVANKGDKARTRKKRQSLNPGIFTPPAAPSSPQWRNQQRSPAPLFRTHRAKDSASTGPSHRWSVFSEQPSDFASSVPSSPLSNPRHSMFDRGFADGSMPGSPTTSVDPMSPTWNMSHQRQFSDLSARAFAGNQPLPDIAGSCPPAEQHLTGVNDPHLLAQPIDADEPAPEDHDEEAEEAGETEEPDLVSNSAATEVSLERADDTPIVAPPFVFPNIDAALQQDAFSEDMSDDPVFTPTRSARPTLHRAMSHESILSLSGGLDIHTLKSRPSQMTLRPIGATTADTGLSAITAQPTISVGTVNGKRGSMFLRDSLSDAGMGLPMPRTRIASGPRTPPTRTNAETPQRAASGGLKLGRFVSWRPWGNNSSSSTTASPSTPTATVEASATPQPRRSKTPTPTSAQSPTPAEIGLRDFSRASGINQPGSIPGFYEYWAAHQRLRAPPSKVLPDVVDQDALREGLEGL